jgi:hypothetical protein
MPGKELERGWALSDTTGAPYHFEHFPLKEAEKRHEASREGHLYVIEAINWTLADKKTCHFNIYFAYSFLHALAIAAAIGLATADGVAEEVIAIRVAEDAEEDLFLTVTDHFSNLMPDAISDTEADSL